MANLSILSEVHNALLAGRPVVALESAVVTHGLPREPLSKFSRLTVPGWDRSSPTNRELARQMQRTVREAGAAPATIAIINGELRIGLDESDLIMLAKDATAHKASIDNMAWIMAQGGNAGTTVSATLAACGLTQSKIQNPKSKIDPIRVFATGGIGGVHRGWQQHLDISADLRALANTPVCVVCSGAKSILDLPATLEALQTLGVPVIGHNTDQFPQFQCRGNDQLRLTQRCDSSDQAAAICNTHWSMLGQSSGIVYANPVPAEFAMDESELQSAIETAEKLAEEKHIAGPARTPFLLAQIAHLTNGKSLDANIALLINNARLAAELAVYLSRQDHVLNP